MSPGEEGRPASGPGACALEYGECVGASPKRRVHVIGTVFFDLVYSGLGEAPRPGTEVRAANLGLAPGGMANIAVALARLGLDVGLSAVFADDAFGHFLWSSLAHEGVDLCSAVRVEGWTTPVTTSVAYSRERSMVTYEQSPPLDVAALLAASYRADALVVSLGGAEPAWLAGLHRHAALVFADLGWDACGPAAPYLREQLAAVDVFLPNAAEALACTGAEEVEDAARALASAGPLVVVKAGGSGALAADPAAGTVVRAPALPVDARDTTGAGDVFDAGIVYASLAGWPLEQRMRFANLCAAESVKLVGGSLSAPCWRDLAASFEALADPELRRAYDFLPELLTACPVRQACTRAAASMASEDGAAEHEHAR